MNDIFSDKYASLEKIIGHQFSDRSLLEEALTHRSRSNELPGLSDNQRLEFFGDSILGFLVSHLLFDAFPQAREGELTSMRASLVDESSLAAIASSLGIGSCLQLGKGEEKGGGRKKKSILSDAFEAVIAAVYLDGGVTAAREVVQRHFSPLVQGLAVSSFSSTDYKTLLQEYTQSRFGSTPSYSVTGSQGPDHARVFTVTVIVNSELCGKGEGSRKKDAEQAAAREALEFFKR
ncbi:MAG: ribonuclease III [Geobacteraceae bacterium]|nr:ribonuclease III [Geobacteraceae bacterium]